MSVCRHRKRFGTMREDCERNPDIEMYKRIEKQRKLNQRSEKKRTEMKEGMHVRSVWNLDSRKTLSDDWIFDRYNRATRIIAECRSYVPKNNVIITENKWKNWENVTVQNLGVQEDIIISLRIKDFALGTRMNMIYRVGECIWSRFRLRRLRRRKKRNLKAALHM